MNQANQSNPKLLKFVIGLLHHHGDFEHLTSYVTSVTDARLV
jgi:hypothetical protein